MYLMVCVASIPTICIAPVIALYVAHLNEFPTPLLNTYSNAEDNKKRILYPISAALMSKIKIAMNNSNRHFGRMISGNDVLNKSSCKSWDLSNDILQFRLLLLFYRARYASLHIGCVICISNQNPLISKHSYFYNALSALSLSTK